MITSKHLLITFILLIGFNGIEANWNNWKPLRFHTPFNELNRDKYSTLHKRTISTYGSHRNSYIKGHKHAGIDLMGKTNKKVYAIAKGKVVDIQLSFPNLTVVVKHEFGGLPPIFSRYTHIEDIRVKIGQKVDNKTCLARLFNSSELKNSRFGVNHLHLEIRTRIDDDCSASWSSLTMTDLNKYCTDPLNFFNKVLN